VKTYRQVLDEYAVHSEPKMAGPDGKVCGRQTVGLLHRHSISPSSITPIGKEANRLEEAQHGLIDDPSTAYTVYVDPWPISTGDDRHQDGAFEFDCRAATRAHRKGGSLGPDAPEGRGTAGCRTGKF